jgi:LysM repeat protein
VARRLRENRSPDRSWPLAAAPESVRRGAPLRSPVLRLTRRGRVTIVAGLLLLCAVLAALVAPPGRAADPAGAPATAVVLPGDTLWSFAARNAPSSTPFTTIDEIRRLNPLDGYVIHPGQRLVLPPRRGGG